MFGNVVKIFAVVLLMAMTAPAQAASPVGDPAAGQVQTFYAALLDTMKRGPQLGMQGRYHALEPAVDSAFDLPTMMQFIVGPSWSTLSDSDRSVLVAAFRRMSVANYASNFQSFHGERFDVDPNVQQRGPDKIVQTTLVPRGDKPVLFTYRMRQSGSDWKIIDIFLQGYVSQAALKRSDFASTMASGGAAALTRKINAIADAVLAAGKTGQ